MRQSSSENSFRDDATRTEQNEVQRIIVPQNREGHQGYHETYATPHLGHANTCRKGAGLDRKNGTKVMLRRHRQIERIHSWQRLNMQCLNARDHRVRRMVREGVFRELVTGDAGQIANQNRSEFQKIERVRTQGWNAKKMKSERGESAPFQRIDKLVGLEIQLQNANHFKALGDLKSLCGGHIVHFHEAWE